MTSFKSIFIVGCLFSLISLEATAADGTFLNIHRHYRAPRAMGMGDAFVAVANDYSAMFYNPAGLARMEQGQINMALDFGLTSNFMTFTNEISKINTGTTQQDRFNAYTSFLQDRFGKIYASRFGLEGIMTRPKWSVAVIPADASFEMSVQNNGAPTINLRSYFDTTVAGAYAGEIKGVPGRLSWGVTGKFVNRGYANKQINALDLMSDSNAIFTTADMREGYIIDGDVGLLYTPQIPTEGLLSTLQLAKPTFGLVIRNILNSGFTKSLRLLNKSPAADAEAPERLYRTIDVGSKWEYPSVWLFSGRGTFDIRDLLHPNYNLRKSMHLGFEFDWSVASWWKGQYRVGLNQMYMTAGMSALFSVFRLDFATYGEDIGFTTEPQENRVYQIKFNIDI